MTFIESETIELKSSVVADLCKEVIAFANTRGGTLYIGVEDNGTVIGVDSADRVTLQINNMVRDSIKPDITMFVHYETQVINDKQIIAVTVQEGTDRPYYLGSKGLKKPMATVLKPCALWSRICHFRQLKHSLPRGRFPMMLLRCRLWEWFPRTTFTPM